MKVGDIVVNPWVSKYCSGLLSEDNLNPNYATIYLGDKKVLDYNGKIKEFCFDTKVNMRDPNEKEREWTVIGHVDIKEIILKTVEKDENNELTNPFGDHSTIFGG